MAGRGCHVSPRGGMAGSVHRIAKGVSGANDHPVQLPNKRGRNRCTRNHRRSLAFVIRRRGRRWRWRRRGAFPANGRAGGGQVAWRSIGGVAA